MKRYALALVTCFCLAAGLLAQGPQQQVLVSQKIAAGGGGHNGYTWNRTVTIDNAQVPNTDQTNFPVLIAGTYTYLKTVANSGDVTDAQGDDIIFTSDSGCTTKLDHEVESYSATTGAVVYWVEVPTVATAADTVIYLCYANSSITTSQQNVAGTWNSSFKRVLHLNDNAASTVVVDSKGLGNGVSLVNTDTRDITGQIDGGQNKDGSGSDLITIADSADLDMGSGFMLEFWVKTSTFTNKSPIGNWNGSTTTGYFWYQVDQNWYVADGTPAWKNVATGGQADGAWHQYVLRWDGSNLYSYRDGAQIGTVAMTTKTESSTALQIGRDSSTSGGYVTGDFDEIRYQTSRSVDWMVTNYNSQSNPGSFYTVGSAVP